MNVIEALKTAEAPKTTESKPPGAVRKPSAPRPSKPNAPPTLVSLRFLMQPCAKVFLDGKELGTTPSPPVQIPEGKHSLRLVNDKLGVEWEEVLTVKGDDVLNQLYKHNLNVKP